MGNIRNDDPADKLEPAYVHAPGSFDRLIPKADFFCRGCKRGHFVGHIVRCELLGPVDKAKEKTCERAGYADRRIPSDVTVRIYRNRKGRS